MTRRLTRDSGGRASLTLLESGSRSKRDDIPIKLDMGGSGFGFEEDVARKPPTSPTSPVTRAMTKNSNVQPAVAVVHRVRLKNFQEGINQRVANRTVQRRFTTGSCMSGDEKDFLGLRSTLESHQSPSQPPRPMSAGHAHTESEGRSVRPASAGQHEVSPRVRSLSSLEVKQRNKDAVEWFRASRAINRSIRSIEDTETLLAQARERRANGIHLLTQRTSKEFPLGEIEPTQEEKPAKIEAAAPPQKRRSVVDPAALWAAKPIVKKEKEEPAPEPQKSCMRGNVQVGEQGQNGLLARLRRRSTIR